jgi:acyl-CoA thioesterase
MVMAGKGAFSDLLGIELVEESKGRAVARIKVSEGGLNRHGVAHGGLIFSLADHAFAAACNYDAPPSMAVHVDVSYMSPAFAGDVLTVEAREIKRGRTMGFYEMMVTNQDGKPIAKVEGISYTRS